MSHLNLDDTGQEYRLDLVDADGAVRKVAHFTAADDDAATTIGIRQLTKWGAAPDEAGDLYTNDGLGLEVHLHTLIPDDGWSGAHDGATAILAADVVLFVEIARQRHVLLIKRGWPPHKGCWALPGGHVDVGEDFPDAAARELAEETGVHVDVGDLVQVGGYGAPGRDPRGRVVTLAYTATLDRAPAPVAGDDAAAVCWVPVADLRPEDLAFDHHTILTDAEGAGS